MNFQEPVDTALAKYASQIDKWVAFSDTSSLDLHGFSFEGIDALRHDQLLPIAELQSSDIEFLDSLIIKQASTGWRWIVEVANDAVSLWEKDFEYRYRFADYSADQLVKTGELESAEQEKVFENGYRSQVLVVRVNEKNQ